MLITGFCGLPAPNRAGAQLRHVLRALGPEHSVDVLVVREGDQAYVERVGSARLLRVPVADDAPRQRAETFRRALRRQLEGADYDVVHFRDAWAGIPVLQMRRQLGYAAVFDLTRAPTTEPPSVDPSVGAELVRDEDTCLAGADLVLAPTEAARRFACAFGRPERVLVAPPGVDVDLFDWDDLPTGPPVVLYAGAIEPGRGLRVLLRAMVEVVKRCDARLQLVGRVAGGEFPRALRRQIAELRLGGRVDVLGEVEHARVPELIARSRVCVAASAAELGRRPTATYPTKLLEYMACRRPVVAPRRGTLRLFMKDGTHGMLFTPGDPVDLAAKILALIGDGPLAQRVADAGYELVRADYTASGARRAVRRAYRALAARSPWKERFAAAERARAALLQDEPGTGLDELEPTAADGDPGATRVDLGTLPERAGDPDRGGLADFTEPRAGAPIDDFTSVEIEDEEPAWTTVERPTLPARAGDEWQVTGTAIAVPPRMASWAREDDGTPVDGTRVADGPPVEVSFVAGEVEVPPAPPELAEDAFTAVSVLLGSDAEIHSAPTEVRKRPLPGRGRGRDKGET